MLVIPAIELKNCRCLRTVEGDSRPGGDIYTDDPAQVALLWRKENAKTLHITDYDGLYSGSLDNFDEILRIASTVEIPIQLVARFATVDECIDFLEGNVYRIIVHDLILEDPNGVRALVARYGSSRISAGIISRVGHISSTWRNVAAIDSLEFAVAARALGVGRLFFTDRDCEGSLLGPNFDELRRIAEHSQMRITAAGGIASVEHLWMLQELEPLGIDSVVIGRAFYENRFPCQQLWRDVEVERIQSQGSLGEDVSTSALT